MISLIYEKNNLSDRVPLRLQWYVLLGPKKATYIGPPPSKQSVGLAVWKGMKSVNHYLLVFLLFI